MNEQVKLCTCPYILPDALHCKVLVALHAIGIRPNLMRLTYAVFHSSGSGQPQYDSGLPDYASLGGTSCRLRARVRVGVLRFPGTSGAVPVPAVAWQKGLCAGHTADLQPVPYQEVRIKGTTVLIRLVSSPGGVWPGDEAMIRQATGLQNLPLRCIFTTWLSFKHN